jgi:hypothetical protein
MFMMFLWMDLRRPPEEVATARPDWIAIEEEWSDQEPKFAQGPYGLKKAEDGSLRVQQDQTSKYANLVSTNQLLEKRVDAQGANVQLGDLEKLVFGAGDGCLVVAVIDMDVEGDPATPERVGQSVPNPSIPSEPDAADEDIAVPITLLELEPTKRMFTADISPQETRGAPEYDDNIEEEGMGLDRQWVESVYRHFNEDLNQLASGSQTPQTKAIALEK